VGIVQHVSDDTLERYVIANPSRHGNQAAGRASSDLLGLPGSAPDQGRIRGSDEAGARRDSFGIWTLGPFVGLPLLRKTLTPNKPRFRKCPQSSPYRYSHSP